MYFGNPHISDLNYAKGYHTVTPISRGGTGAQTAAQAAINLGIAAGYQPLDADLTALAALSSTAGIMSRTGANAFAVRTLTGTANQIVISNPTGSGGDPVFSLPQDIAIGSTPRFASLGLGSAASTTARLITGGTLSGGATQYGFFSGPTFNSGTTAAAYGTLSSLATSAAVFNCAAVFHHEILDISLGAGSSVTTQYGFHCGTLSSATTNWGVYINNNKSYMNGSLILAAGALATSATDGFLYGPSCAGAPTGTPTAFTGTVPEITDTTNNQRFYYAGGGWRRTDDSPFVAKTATYTVTASDRFVSVDCTGGAIVINLPTAVGITGRTYIIKRIDASANTITITPNGSETIDGAATKGVVGQWTSVSVMSNGTAWLIF